MKFELYDLKQKEVVNMLDGKILGTIDDFEIDDEDGRIISAIIPESSGKLFNFFSKGEEYIIPWSCIKKIGEDTILIELKDTPKYRDDDDDD
jgi:YlmC/YmxH family sporulation protein